MTRGIEIPEMVGASGVAKILGISRNNIGAQQRVKNFPDPITMIDGRKIWLKSDIEKFKRSQEMRRSLKMKAALLKSNQNRREAERNKPIEKMTLEEARAAGRLDEFMDAMKEVSADALQS